MKKGKTKVLGYPYVKYWGFCDPDMDEDTRIEVAEALASEIEYRMDLDIHAQALLLSKTEGR